MSLQVVRRSDKDKNEKNIYFFFFHYTLVHMIIIEQCPMNDDKLIFYGD
jgi:hypothetical protein